MNVDRRGLTRGEIYKVLKENRIRLKGSWTSRNMIAVLDENGVEWGKVDRMTATCPTCQNQFDPKGDKTGPGRDKKHCSDLCRKKAGGLITLRSEARKCAECNNVFIPKKGRGKGPLCCSNECLEKRKRSYYKSDHYLNAILPKHREKAKEKNKIKNLTRIKNCRLCGSQYQRLNTWYCSDKCRLTHKTELKRTYYRIPSVAEKIKVRSKLPHARVRINKWVSKRRKERRESDPIYLAKERIRCRTKAAFNGIGFAKGCKTREMIGCSWEQFKDHIESQFLKGMKWSNRHLWHIDHIIPLSEGDTVEKLEKLSHFSNLRPLWAEANNLKSDNVITCQPELLLRHE